LENKWRWTMKNLNQDTLDSHKETAATNNHLDTISQSKSFPNSVMVITTLISVHSVSHLILELNILIKRVDLFLNLWITRKWTPVKILFKLLKISFLIKNSLRLKPSLKNEPDLKLNHLQKIKWKEQLILILNMILH